jgi:hypothetical protein
VHSWAEAKSTIAAFPGGSGGVVFAAGFDCTYTSQIDISGSVTITGTSTRVVCDAGGAGKFFFVGACSSTSCSGALVLRLPITFKNGHAGCNVSTIQYSLSQHSLSLNGANRDMLRQDGGGAIYNFGGTLSIEGAAIFESNRADEACLPETPSPCRPGECYTWGVRREHAPHPPHLAQH